MFFPNAPRLSPEQARELAPEIFKRLPRAVGIGSTDRGASESPLDLPMTQEMHDLVAMNIMFAILLSL